MEYSRPAHSTAYRAAHLAWRPNAVGIPPLFVAQIWAPAAQQAPTSAPQVGAATSAHRSATAQRAAAQGGHAAFRFSSPTFHSLQILLSSPSPFFYFHCEQIFLPHITSIATHEFHCLWCLWFSFIRYFVHALGGFGSVSRLTLQLRQSQLSVDYRYWVTVNGYSPGQKRPPANKTNSVVFPFVCTNWYVVCCT